MLALAAFGTLGTAAVVAIESGRSPEATGGADIGFDLEARDVIARDQAPHTGRLSQGVAPRSALERAVLADVTRRIARGELAGRVTRVRCAPTTATLAGRRPFRCTAPAGAVSYPFLGVVDLRARRVTWCKRDPPPVPALDVPVSRRCRG